MQACDPQQPVFQPAGTMWIRSRPFPLNSRCCTLFARDACRTFDFGATTFAWFREGSRRKAVFAASLATSALLTFNDALAQAAFPPPPPKVSPAAGVIDMHVHAHPDVFGRNLDDIDVATLAKARGMRGIVLKNPVLEDVTASVRSVRAGHYWLRGGEVTNLVSVRKELMVEAAPAPKNTFGLTPRELDVVRNVVQGGTNRDIATSLGISEETVKRHLTNAFDKTGVSNRLELALFAMHHQLVAPEGA